MNSLHILQIIIISFNQKLFYFVWDNFFIYISISNTSNWGIICNLWHWYNPIGIVNVNHCLYRIFYRNFTWRCEQYFSLHFLLLQIINIQKFSLADLNPYIFLLRRGWKLLRQFEFCCIFFLFGLNEKI